MFQYTKENILNDVPVIKKSGEKVIIEGLGEYTLSGIVDKTVYETEGNEGKKAQKTLDFTGLTVGKEYVLTFRVITPDQYLAEYASPNWQVFGKPIIVGFNYKDVASLVESIKLAIPEGNTYFKVGTKDSKVELTATTPYMDFDKVAIELVEKKENDVVPTVQEAYVQKRIAPFATKEWLIENLRFPTYPNIRYASASAMPTANVYTEFAFTYEVPRVGLGGLSGVGQGMTAVTRHIFYLPKGEKANAFKTALTEALGATLKFDTNAPEDTNKNYENNFVPDDTETEE